MRHVFETMGTVASVELPPRAADLLPSLESVFFGYDERFSLYRPDSEVSRIARGDLELGNASEQMIATYARATAWRERTDGAFTPHRPDGVLDLNGIVKAEAIEQAGLLLDGAGWSNWTVNVGGDILVGQHDQPESIGIVDPTKPTDLLCALRLTGSRRAVATSGSTERGDHIWRGGSTAAPDFLQATVIADDIVTADVLATTIIAAGEEGLDDLTSRWDIDAVIVNRDGALRATPGAQDAMRVSAASR